MENATSKMFTKTTSVEQCTMAIAFVGQINFMVFTLPIGAFTRLRRGRR